jgi:uncharacterized protein (TIGR03437 family)
MLIVWSGPAPAITVSPASLHFTAQAGRGTGNQTLNVSTGSLPLPISFAAQVDNNANWLGASEGTDRLEPHYTPFPIYVWANAEGPTAFPGVYSGRIMITAPPGSGNTVIVPVTFTVTPAPALVGTPPLIGSLVNGASMVPGPISPGEIVSIFGILGPDVKSGVNISRDGKVNTISYGNRVLFNGVAAPLIYMSPTQINAVVPYEIAGSPIATVELDMSGIRSPAWAVPVAPSVPGLFTQSGSGHGAAAILNQDNSVNGPSNAASRGSIVQIFATGEGQTNPPSITGAITQLDTKNPLVPPTVLIGGIEARIVSATTAPMAIAGLFQINAQIPSTLPAGSLPVVIRFGSTSSQAGATIQVR